MERSEAAQIVRAIYDAMEQSDPRAARGSQSGGIQMNVTSGGTGINIENSGSGTGLSVGGGSTFDGAIELNRIANHLSSPNGEDDMVTSSLEQLSRKSGFPSAVIAAISVALNLSGVM